MFYITCEEGTPDVFSDIRKIYFIAHVSIRRFNELSKLATGEGTSAAQTRSTIFDISFLMLCHISELYGLQVNVKYQSIKQVNVKYQSIKQVNVKYQSIKQVNVKYQNSTAYR